MKNENTTLVKVKCITNLNSYKSEVWPTELVCIPQIGNVVESLSGRMLEITKVIHSTETIKGSDGYSIKNETIPVIKIELNKEV